MAGPLTLALALSSALAAAWGPVAHVQTYYDMSSRARSHNIELAARRIGRFHLAEGASFSFNTAAPDEPGYLPDRVFADGRVTVGVGGGVCQVASTIYAAALRAGMTILERHPHGLPISYLPLGEDATVAATLDLRFRNDGPGPVDVSVGARGGVIDVRFSGPARRPPVHVVHRVIRQIPFPIEKLKGPPPPPLRLGKGMDGARVETLVVVREGGRIVRRHVSDDTYRPLPRQVIMGGSASATQACRPPGGVPGVERPSS